MTAVPQSSPSPAREAGSSYLDVRDLQVHFQTDDGLVKSVDGLSFHVEQGQTLGIVGESGSGKSVTSMAVMGLHTAKNARIAGSIKLDGQELVGADKETIRSLRGKRMAMIFQDPLSSMHPFYSVGNQIVEAYRIHNDVSTKVARAHAIEMLAALKRRLRKTFTSSIGWSVWRSQAMNAAMIAPPAAEAARMIGLLQPCSGASIRAQMTALRPAMDRPVPGRSSLGESGSRESGTSAKAPIRHAATTGRLIRKRLLESKCSSR